MAVLLIRPATVADAPALAETVRQGFETYRAWAPRGWDPPVGSLQLSGIHDRLLETGCTCMIAEEDGEPVGQVGHVRARDEPGVAHLWMLFVREPWWGTSLATDLLARDVAAARAEGYTAMRLHTPAEHRRARAFYEREGWSTDAQPFYEGMLGLTLVTYRRSL